MGLSRGVRSSLISAGLLEALHWVRSLAHSRRSIHACRRRTRNLYDPVEFPQWSMVTYSLGKFPSAGDQELGGSFPPKTRRAAETLYAIDLGWHLGPTRKFRVQEVSRRLQMDALSPTACKAVPTWQKPFLRPREGPVTHLRAAK